ncbi:UNVERIFIED_CONTAM: LINE-1 reverse transcriptase, partial [Sesamum indicum]
IDSSTTDDGVCGTDTSTDVGDETADDGGPASGGQNFGNGAGKEKLQGFREEKKMRTLVSLTTSSLPMDGNPISLEGMTTELVDFVHRTFTRWIEECVSTTSFSIGLNGKPHGFFTGARGLRQGDPLSPYLFVLVMEVLHLGFLQRIEQDMQFTYHWKCENSMIFQLGFAKDLLLFCRADGDSIRVFKEGLDRFAELSGLRLNVHKSHLIISRSAQELKDQMLDILGFQEGHLLMRVRHLFGYAKVAWKDVCRSADEGGLGFKDISTLNRALMSKKLCDVIRCDRTSILVQRLYEDRLRNTSIWTVSEHGGSWGWQKMLRLRPFLRSIVDYQIGNRERFCIWQDPWHHLGPLIERFPRAPHHLGIEKSAKLSSVISAGEWQWLPITDFECLEITHNLPIISGGEDRVVWRCDGGLPTTQALYRVFDPPEPKVGWASLLSGSLKIPRHSFILWLAILGKLPTTDKPWLSHFGDCILCNEGEIETHSHLFFQCRFSRQCLTAIRRKVRFHWPNRDWANDIEWASRRWRGKHIVNIAYRALLASSVYHIWRERNLRRFVHIERTPSTMALLIVDDVRQRIISISLASSVSTRALYRLWRIP